MIFYAKPKRAYVFLTALFITNALATEYHTHNQTNMEVKMDKSILEIRNDEEKDLKVYVQSGDGSLISESFQVSFVMPRKSLKRLVVTKDQMGGDNTFSIIGGTGTIDTTMSVNNRCKGLSFGQKYDIRFSATTLGGTACESKSLSLTKEEQESLAKGAHVESLKRDNDRTERNR